MQLANSMPSRLSKHMPRQAPNQSPSRSPRRTPLDRLRPSGGFTLIEILVVVVIIGILAAVVVPRFMDEPDRARAVKARQDIEAIVSALRMYNLDNSVYPSTQQGLEALVERPGGRPEARNWKEGGYLERLPNDPWGRPYLYMNPGVHSDVDVWSNGANGQPGGEGANAEIGNWMD